mmetsp:Transcript_25735/g.59384  ORF Transcript_25735/g.59384 Transcript_25735/m.59384 type:complete len:208 (-) Transcript_25735:226-849(-)
MLKVSILSNGVVVRHWIGGLPNKIRGMGQDVHPSTDVFAGLTREHSSVSPHLQAVRVRSSSKLGDCRSFQVCIDLDSLLPNIKGLSGKDIEVLITRNLSQPWDVALREAMRDVGHSGVFKERWSAHERGEVQLRTRDCQIRGSFGKWCRKHRVAAHVSHRRQTAEQCSPELGHDGGVVLGLTGHMHVSVNESRHNEATITVDHGCSR